MKWQKEYTSVAIDIGYAMPVLMARWFFNQLEAQSLKRQRHCFSRENRLSRKANSLR